LTSYLLFLFPLLLTPVPQALCFGSDLFPEGFRLQDHGMGTPAHDLKLDFVGPCHLRLECDGTVGLGVDEGLVSDEPRGQHNPLGCQGPLD